jgi:hypothetical protein
MGERAMYPVNSWQDIGALASAAAASIAMIAIGLAWAATVIAKRSTDIGRRGYLDAKFDQLEVANRKFEMAELPFWSVPRDEGRIRKGDYRTVEAGTPEYERFYPSLHDAVLGVRDIVSRLRRSGLVEAEGQIKGELDDTFDDMLTMFEASRWASYLHLVYGFEAESMRWLETSASGDDPSGLLPILEAWEEVEFQLKGKHCEHPNPDAIRRARDKIIKEYKTDALEGVANLIDAVRSSSLNDAADRYRLIADEVAPWHKKPRTPWKLSAWLKELLSSLKLPSWLKKLRKSWRLRKPGFAANQ